MPAKAERWPQVQPGFGAVNLEIDLIARYVERMLGHKEPQSSFGVLS